MYVLYFQVGYTKYLLSSHFTDQLSNLNANVNYERFPKGGFFQKVRCVFQISKSPQKDYLEIWRFEKKDPHNLE